MSEGLGDDSPAPRSFEDALAALEAIVHDLEDGQLGLAESLARYEQGVGHLKHCHQLLAAAEQKIELLTGVNEDGTPRTQPWEEPGPAAEDAAGRRRRGKTPRPKAGSGETAEKGDIDV
jgi:exodeoxyribonuclease VII small subunit